MPEGARESAFVSERLQFNKGAEETVRELLRSLLESGEVAAVLALGRTGGSSGGVAYSLFRDPEAFGEKGDALPLLPLMPANAGGLLSRLTLEGPVTEPVAAVVKPCELRAFIELVKLNQGSLDNILLISSTCAGVYPLDIGIDGSLEDRLPAHWEGLKQGVLDDDVRPACRACEHFVPEGADITVALLGETDLDTRCTLCLNTEKGATFARDMEGTRVPGEMDSEALAPSHGEREAFREELFAGVGVGLKELIHTFGRCIGCHGCKTVCPICYCRLCYFDSQHCERPMAFYEGELARKGGLRVPSDTVFFHLGRMAHMAISCVGCGMCTDVCPADIPISTMFSKVGAAAQAVFDYQPGRDVGEEIPLRTFEQEEFTQVVT